MILDYTVSFKCGALYLHYWPQLFRKGGKAFQWINLYPVDTASGFPYTYPLGNDLSSG